MKERPRVTVLMSAYNAEQFVGEAVESVLGQTFDDFEFLIFEDKSRDMTLQVLRSYADRRIRLVENRENRGLTKNLVTGMEMARGEFVARMDADDVCMPERLAAQVGHMDQHPDISVLGSAVTFFTEAGKQFVAHQPLEHEEIKCALFYGFSMLHPTVMSRRADLERHGLNYDPAFPVSQDHDLWTRAIREVHFANLHDSLVQMREHEGKIGRTRKPLQQELSNSIRQRQFEELELDVTAQELKIFGEHETSGIQWTRDDVQLFEALLFKVFEANNAFSVFDQRTLVKMGVSHFRGACRQMLIEGNLAGRYYWCSRLKNADHLSLREFIGLSFHSFGLGRVNSKLRLAGD